MVCIGNFVRVGNKGAFKNYVDQILRNFDPLPASSGQAWTFNIQVRMVSLNWFDLQKLNPNLK